MFRSQLREKHHVPDGGLVGEEHNQPVDADPFAGRRRHAELQRAQEVLVHEMGFFVSGRPLRRLAFEPLALIQRIVQL